MTREILEVTPEQFEQIHILDMRCNAYGVFSESMWIDGLKDILGEAFPKQYGPFYEFELKVKYNDKSF